MEKLFVWDFLPGWEKQKIVLVVGGTHQADAIIDPGLKLHAFPLEGLEISLRPLPDRLPVAEHVIDETKGLCLGNSRPMPR